jgi:hypothetical protein
MNYPNIYNQLINRAKLRDPISGYVEKHHIIPKCMGGTDDIINLVILTAEEHYLAHQLLVKIYPDNGKLLFATHMMTRTNGKHIRNNKEYSWLRKRRSNYLSKISTGVTRGKYAKDTTNPYLTAIHLQKFLPIKEFYKLDHWPRIPVPPKDVLNILSILWTYG